MMLASRLAHASRKSARIEVTFFSENLERMVFVCVKLGIG